MERDEVAELGPNDWDLVISRVSGLRESFGVEHMDVALFPRDPMLGSKLEEMLPQRPRPLRRERVARGALEHRVSESKRVERLVRHRVP